MKARVFVTLKPSVFDPQGQHDRRSAALARLRRRRRRAAGQVLRARARRRPSADAGARRSASEVADKLLANPVIESYRDRESDASDHEVRRRRLSRLQLRSRRVSRGEARARPGGRVRLAQGHRPGGRRRRRSCPAASRTATTCAPAPSRASRRSCSAVQAFAERGGPVLGICNGFQILLEARPAARRDAAQPRPEVPLRARARPRRADRHAVHVRRARRARCCGFRSRTARATTTPTPDVLRELEASRPVVFRYCDRRRAGRRRGEPERVGPRHRRHLQRRRATSSA